MFKRIVTSALIFGMAALAPPAGAQAACTDRERITERLAGEFAETPLGIGLKSPTEIIEIWSAAETRTWTLLLSNADGQSCVIASGISWISVPEPHPGTLALNLVRSDVATK